MTSPYQPISPLRHAQRSWRRYTNYLWAATQTVAPIVAPEVAHAALQFPIGFVDTGDKVITVGVLGLEAGANLFVGGDGRWLGGYIPAALRMRPFALLPTTDGKKVLCVDEVAGEVGEAVGAPDTEPFFAPDGELAPAVRQVMEFVSNIENAKAPTEAAAAALKQHGLLVPWAISIETDEGPRAVEGLLRADEPALGRLGDEAFLELRHANALPLLYAHLLSTQHLALLAQLGRARAQAIRQQKVMPVTPSGELDLSFMNAGDTLRFS